MTASRRTPPRIAYARCTLVVALMGVLLPTLTIAGPVADNVTAIELDRVRSRIESTKASTTLDSTIRDRLVEIATKELESLEARNRWLDTQRGYEDRLRTIPGELKTLSREAGLPVQNIQIPGTASIDEAVDLLVSLSDPPPRPIDQVPVTRLEEELLKREAERELALKSEASGEEDRKFRSNRRAELPKLITSLRTRIDEFKTNLKAPAIPATDPDNVILARASRDRAMLTALETELATAELEARVLEAEAPLLPLRGDRMTRKASQIQTKINVWRLLIDARRRLEGVKVRAEASRTLQQVQKETPELRTVLEENARLAAARANLVQALEDVSATLGEEEKRLSLISSGYRSLRQRGELTGPSEVIARWLRQQRSKLPPTSRLKRKLRKHQEDLGRGQFELLETQEARTRLGNLDQVSIDTLEELRKSGIASQTGDTLRQSIKQLLEIRRKILDGLRDDYETYLKRLGRVAALEEELLKSILAYGEDIDQRILWISSAQPLSVQDITSSQEPLAWLLSPERGSELHRFFKSDLTTNPALYLFGSLLVALLFSLHPRYRSLVRLRGQQVRTDPTSPIDHTLESVFLSILAAVTWVLPILALGWRLAYSGVESTAFTKALGTGLVGVSWVMALLLIIRESLRLDGFFDAHLAWPQSVTQEMRKGVGLAWLPVLFMSLVHVMLEIQDVNEAWKPTLGRLVFCLTMLGATMLLAGTLGIKGVPVRIAKVLDPNGVFFRYRWIWRLCGVGLPLALLTLSLAGYHYTSVRLASQLPATLSWLLFCLYLQTIGVRWLRLIRKRLQDTEEVESRAERGEDPSTELTDSVDGHSAVTDQPIDAAVSIPRANQPIDAAMAIPRANQPIDAAMATPRANQPIDAAMATPQIDQPIDAVATAISSQDAIRPAITPAESPAQPIVEGTTKPHEARVEEPQPNPERVLPALDLGTQQAANLMILMILIGGLLSIWNEVLPALGALDRVVVWSTTTMESVGVPREDGTTIFDLREVPLDVGLADLIFAMVALFVTAILSGHLPQVLDGTILNRLPLDRGSRYAVRTLTQYTLTAIGLVFSSSLIGIRWVHVQWLIAAISVGLGFGLQEIFANFISGLILLFERPIRVGDIVTIGDVTGTVLRMQIRATTILDFERRELVVPNKEFITGRFVNLTLSDKTARMAFPVGIAYGSDTDRAQEILNSIGLTCPDTLNDPPPHTVFRGFGDSTLNLELRVFIPTRDVYLQVLTHINTKIAQEFQRAGIEIAFPQRDFHLRSVPPGFPTGPFIGESVEER